MENASKALMIAGGVLIAVLILSVMVYVYSHIQSVERSKAEILKTEELSKFNREFESYNKKNMYGTDIVSVVNKAISYNENYGKLITIKVKTKEIFSTTVTYWRLDGTKDDSKSSETIKLKADVVYSSEQNDFIMFLNENEQKGTQNDYDSNKNKIGTIETKPAISEFKNRKFECTSVEYDSNSGRVKVLNFCQI